MLLIMSNTKKQVYSAFKYIANMKQQFLISELQNYITMNLSIIQIYDTIKPLLNDLNLQSTPYNNDFCITHKPDSVAIDLTPIQKDKFDNFFKSAKVSEQLQHIIEQYISKKTGKNWDDAVIVDRIRKAIVSQKNNYWKEGPKRKISYEKGYDIFAYLAYHFPVYFIQFQYILYELLQLRILKSNIKILDIGTGIGTIPLAVTDFYKKLGEYKADIYTIELYDENIEVFNSIVPSYASDLVTIHEPIKANIHNTNFTHLPKNIDLIIFSNVLNEMNYLDLESKSEIVEKFVQFLANDGSIIIIEPADKVNSIDMRRLSILLKKRGLNIYSPCSFIRKIGCTLQNCWSFEQKSCIDAPILMQKLADCREFYRYINTDIKYSYVVLRKDKQIKYCYHVPKKSKFAILSKIHVHKGKRINVVGALMSQDLGDTKYSVYRLCDGTSKKAVYAILPIHNINDNNILLKQTKYGEIIEIYNVLVHYNKEKDGYNLLLSRNSIVRNIEKNTNKF